LGANTNIEWTDSTWNPLRGCSRVSEGCRNCYAEKVAYRFSGAGQAYEGLAILRNGHAGWTGKVELVEKHLLDPLKWKGVPELVPGSEGVEGQRAKGQTKLRRRRIFVNSMSDLFHESVPDAWIDRIFAVMALCPQHDFQVLTKRPARMLAYFGGGFPHPGSDRVMAIRVATAPLQSLAGYPRDAIHFPLPNVWLGVSVENQVAADDRIPLLLQTAAAARFISAEPLLGPVSLRWKNSTPFGTPHPRHLKPDPDGAGRVCTDEYDGLRELDWVIVGGESGAGGNTRSMKPSWARTLRDQCQAANVPFFFKQWGEWIPTEDPKVAEQRGVPLGECMSYVGKKAAGAQLDGREWREFPREAING